MTRTAHAVTAVDAAESHIRATYPDITESIAVYVLEDWWCYRMTPAQRGAFEGSNDFIAAVATRFAVAA